MSSLITKKIIPYTLITLTILCGTFTLTPPKKVLAAFPVVEVPGAHLFASVSTAFTQKTQTFFKDLSMDSIAWMVGKMAVGYIVQSTVSWINGGFQGSPAFVQDPGRFAASIVDREIGRYIYNDPQLRFLCSPFQLQIRRALILNRSFATQARCTLTDVVGNVEGFVNGANNQLGQLGGWTAWNTYSTYPQNNPYGAYALFSAELTGSVNEVLIPEQNLLDWGKGFFSWRDPSCVSLAKSASEDFGTDDNYGYSVQGLSIDDSLDDPNFVGADESRGADLQRRGGEGVLTVQTSSARSESNCSIQTPGSVIADQLNSALKLPAESLVTADEISEIIGALLGQLVTNVLGGGGLSGLSQGDGYGGQSFVSRLAEESLGEINDGKNLFTSRVEERKEVENDLILVRNRSIDEVELTATKFDAVVKCYEEKLATTTQNNFGSTFTTEEKAIMQERLNKASSTASTVRSFSAPYLTDIKNAQKFIAEYNRIITEVRAVGVGQQNKLSLLSNDFSNALQKSHNESDVFLAEDELANTLPEKLAPFNTQGDQDLNTCRAFPADPANVNSG